MGQTAKCRSSFCEIGSQTVVKEQSKNRSRARKVQSYQRLWESLSQMGQKRRSLSLYPAELRARMLPCGMRSYYSKSFRACKAKAVGKSTFFPVQVRCAFFGTQQACGRARYAKTPRPATSRAVPVLKDAVSVFYGLHRREQHDPLLRVRSENAHLAFDAADVHGL